MQRKESLRSIMFVGTGSDVGKSVITAGFCRIFRQDGYDPAPYKAQNMSLNSYVTPEGLEIGRAQAVQAEASGIPCHTDMNPVLLKPTTDKNAQVILNGKPYGNFSASEYFRSEGREELFTEVKQAYHRLAARYSPIVMEGAGSISELNLRHLDITNMRMAMAAGAATYLITDIDRGGVFGSCFGTMALLTSEERACIKGIIINKFRGDAALFEDGRKMLEKLCRVPVVGIVPYFRDIVIEEEDAIHQRHMNNGFLPGKVNIAVVLLLRLSNFTDFDYLRQDPRINLFYVRNTEDIEKADIIILPGSKNTIEDLQALHDTGIADAIRHAHAKQKTIVGICGGYQMMGITVDDPGQVETNMGAVAGLGILPVSTVMQPNKTTLQRKFRFRDHEDICEGYEIHMGDTTARDVDRPLNHFVDKGTDGYFLNERCWGTYLHGILDNPSVVDALIAPYTGIPGKALNYRQYRETQYDKLAALLRQNIDMKSIYKTLLFFFILVTAFSCRQPATQNTSPDKVANNDTSQVRTTIKYARGFTIEYFDGYKLVRVLDREGGKKDTLEYLLVQQGHPTPAGYPDAQVIPIPVASIVAMSSMHVGIADFTGVADRITGLGSLQYVNSPVVRANIKAGKVAQVGLDGNLNNELLISMHPGLVMAMSNPDASTGQYKVLIKAGVPVMLNAEWLESTPMARAEWVKLMAALVNKEEMVNKKFDSVAAAYDQLVQLSSKAKEHPRVIIGMPYKGTWYLPSGDSYMTHFIKDAGGDYKWADNKGTGSLALNFESAAPEALTADYWMNIGDVHSKQEIAGKDPRYAGFRSFKTGHVYNNNKRTNDMGSNDYWESGGVNPHIVLADMISILHPELLPGHTLIYYKQLL